MANTMAMADDDDFETRPTLPCPPPEVERATTLLPPDPGIPEDIAESPYACEKAACAECEGSGVQELRKGGYSDEGDWRDCPYCHGSGVAS